MIEADGTHTMVATSWQSSDRCGGARLFSALQTKTASLNSTRCRTGNQCRCYKTGCQRPSVLQRSVRCDKNEDIKTYDYWTPATRPLRTRGRGEIEKKASLRHVYGVHVYHNVRTASWRPGSVIKPLLRPTPRRLLGP